MVLVVALYNLPKPCTDCGCAMVLPALKLSLNGFELRDHPLLRRDPPDDEGSIGEPPTEVGKAQECEGLWFSLSTLLPVADHSPTIAGPAAHRRNPNYDMYDLPVV